MPESTKKYSKVIYGGKTLIDLTADTVKADKLLTGTTAHGADGELVTGTCDFDMNTQPANASASEILLGKTAGVKPNNGAVTGIIASKDEEYTIPKGHHDGSGKVSISSEEKAKLIPDNIRDGITVLGVAGTMSGTEGAVPQAKTVTPSTIQQEILPDTEAGYNYLSSVTVAAIPYTETDNEAGGVTVSIA